MVSLISHNPKPNNINFQQQLIRSQIRQPRIMSRDHEKRDLSGTHGGLKSGETVVERAEDTDHVVGDGLAFL